MKTSKTGIELIKRFEGLRLKAYKAVPSEIYYTIGYGHYGADVSKDMIIDETTAEMLLKNDLLKSENAVNRYVDFYGFSQNHFDALVSFTFNCGVGNFQKLINNGSRTISQIAVNMLKYNKAGGKEIAGLTKRRKAEYDLFMKDTNAFYDDIAKQTNRIKYTVKKGDTLWGLADKFYGYGVKWRRIYEENNLDTTTLKVGQILLISLK